MNNNKKIFVYTILVFIAICLVSYAVNAQQQKLSLKQAVSLTIVNNREIKIANLDIDKSQQQIRIAKSMTLPTANVSVQAAHYFLSPVFFGFGNNGNSDKISYGRFGG